MSYSMKMSLNSIFANIWTTCVTVIFGILFVYLLNFYRKVFSLPPGPLPLPIIGNVLEFRSKHHFKEVLKNCSKIYGPVFTFWIGNTPSVFICDIEIARTAFNKKEFAGRMRTFIASCIANEISSDVIFADYGKTWQNLRKVAHSAAQRFAKNQKIPYLVTDCVDKTVQMILKKEGVNKEFLPNQYFYHLFFNIMTNAAFGQNYSLEDEEFNKFKYTLSTFMVESGSNRLILWEFSSLMRLIDRKLMNKFRNSVLEIKDSIHKYYQDHLIDFNDSIERDFCDELIKAKNEALRDGKEAAAYLTSSNLSLAILDLFEGGTDTGGTTFRWCLLFLSYYPEIQQNLRQEIESEIGDRMPTHEDRNHCHYVMAFISEITRLRNVIPSGIPHKAVVTSKIGDYTIPEGTTLFVLQDMILTDEKYWPNAHEFRPERFLEEGKYMTNKLKAFIPFGVGRRVCLGENIAIANLFLVLVRFLQKTSDYDIVLEENSSLEANPNVSHLLTPKDTKIMFKTKSTE